MSQSSSEKFRVRFVTTYVQYKVPETAIAIPHQLGRYGMSEVINHLLELDPPVPFDFMIEETLIRSSLGKFLAWKHIDGEKVIEVKYMPVTSLSNESDTTECPAWIGALDCPVYGDIIFVGCYDGQLRTVGMESYDIVSSVDAHDGPIRSVSAWVDQGSGNTLVATGSKDQKVKVWNVKDNGSMSLISTGLSSVSSVESVKYWKSENKLLSSDYGGNIFVYSLSGNDISSINDENDSKQPSKKSKVSNGGSKSSVTNELPFQCSIRAHTQAISGMDIGNDAGRVYTCSFDHSLKEWDMERQDCVATFVGGKVCTSMHIRPGNNLIATSHPDGRVRMWDSRSRQDATCAGVFPPAQAPSANVHWISQVKWIPHNTHNFATSNYNGEVSVWDIRSTVPISTSEVHSGKVLCLDWLAPSNKNAPIRVVSGGSDCAIKSTIFA